jgi:hypothetical protein
MLDSTLRKQISRDEIAHNHLEGTYGQSPFSPLIAKEIHSDAGHEQGYAEINENSANRPTPSVWAYHTIDTLSHLIDIPTVPRLDREKTEESVPWNRRNLGSRSYRVWSHLELFFGPQSLMSVSSCDHNHGTFSSPLLRGRYLPDRICKCMGPSRVH